jgi:chromosome segregation protein
VSVRIRSVTIQGFKSFGEKVRLEFHEKVNAVIGPNGSGKSNVIEGIRWASHTARTRELRVRESTELIFHGSTGKAPLGLAEVELELEQFGAANLNISRRLYRDGDSDLELAGRTIRVRDLHDVLRGSGLGPGGLAVVGQGEIGAVIGANPETMLGYLEEAAGLSRATHRRAQSIERLEGAKLHLERATDLTLEVKQRVQKLEKEAQAALEAAGLHSEINHLEGALQRHRIRTLTDEIAVLERESQETQAASNLASDSIQAAGQNLEALRLRREATQLEFAKRSAEVQRLQGEARALRERASAADANLVGIERETNTLKLEGQTLASLEPPLAPQAPEDQIPALEAALEQSRTALRNAENLELQARKNYADARSKRDSQLQESSQRREKLAAMTFERETIGQELSTCQNELQTIAGELVNAQNRSDEARAEFEASNKMLDKLERESSLISSQISENGTRAAELRAARTPIQKEFARLEASRQSRANLSEGPRKALNSKLDGIIGPVADLITVPEHLETALGAALGRRVEQIVVKNGDVAKAVIEHLKRIGGRATFLPLELLRSRSRRETPLVSEKGVLGFAADLIQSEYRVVVDNLLGDTLVIENLEIALKLAKKHPNRPRLVTLEGELLEAGGAVTGGKGRDSAGETFGETRRLNEAKAELERLEQDLTTVEQALVEHREAAQTSREAVVRADGRLKENRERLDSARDSILALETRQESLERRISQLETRLKNLPSAGEGALEDASFDADLSPLESLIVRASDELSETRGLERQKDADLREARQRVAVFVEQQRTHEAAFARFQQSLTRLETIRSRLEELHLAQLEIQNRLSEANPEIARLEKEAEQLDLEVTRIELANLETERKRLEAELSLQSQNLSVSREKLENQKLARARREANLETLIRELIDDPENETELPGAGALERLLEFENPEGTPRNWATRINQIRSRLDELGAVNPLAKDEFESESKRLLELENGIADSSAAVLELETALEQLEREVTSKLRESIKRVTEAFRAHILELLGGEGEVELVRDEAGALEGLSLRVTPKGKRTRSLHLLSTGERTMAALGFLFALAQAPEDSRGLPLAVLDEVDAPLDEANIRRFTQFLRVLADKGTQFILVTHQKATMEIADALWGVTTDASGVSRTFSIKNDSIEQYAVARAF